MLKFVESFANTLEIGIVFDSSFSMITYKDAAIDSLNTQLKSFREEAEKSGIVTRISIQTFDSEVHPMSIDRVLVKDTKDIDKRSYHPSGNTALFDAIGEMLNYLRLVDAGRRLLLIITDGEENCSESYHLKGLTELIKNLNNTWTVVACVPPGHSHRMMGLGIPSGNITQWESSSKGIESLGHSITMSNSNLFASYSAGNTSTRSYFQPDVSNLKPEVVQSNLNDVSNKFRSYQIKSSSELVIANFVNQNTNTPYRIGRAFYQLTKKEKVQASKEIVVENKTNGKLYSGEDARSLLRIPKGGELTLAPTDNKEYNIYIQSTSWNRKLVPNTKILVKVM